MQRVNRSAPAPKGVAFFLFLGVAIVPFSLRMAGVQVSFSPSFSAAADAWQQIADVFGSGYQPARALTSPAPADQGTEPSRAFDSSACPSREFACAREVNDFSAIAENVSKVLVAQAGTTRRQCPRVLARASTIPAAVEQGLAAAPGRESLQTYVRALGMLRTVKFEAVPHGQLVSNDLLLKDVERQIVERSLAIPQSLKMLVRVKVPVIPSAAKAAQCKVRAALDSTRRIERERAILTSLSSTNPDNCEL